MPTFRRRWTLAGSVAIAAAIVGLSVAALVPRASSGPWPSLLVTLVLLGLGLAISLHVRFLLLVRRAHGETARVLEAGEREFESIFDSTLDAIVILDDQGICREANPAALALFGTQRQQLVGHPLRRFYLAASGPEATRDPLLDRNCAHGEIELVRRNGETLFAEYTVKTNYLPKRHVAVLRDISSRREAERALRESDERYRQMADNIQEVYWMLDAGSKHILSINPAYETLTGRSLETLRANPTAYQELFHPEDRVRVLTRLEEAGETGQIDEEFRIIRPDRAVRWVSVHGFPVRDAAGVVRRLVGTAQDITARKSAEEQMARNLALAESA
jgi:PAS domain S-box-containing protein